jgi:hypothetical protein
MIRQLTGFLLVVPYHVLTGRKVEGIADFFHQGAGEQFGLWEMNMVLSPGLLLLLILGLGYWIYTIVKTRPAFSASKVIAAVILCLGLWLAADLTLAQGWLYSLLKPLPVLRSLHANVRFTSAFIFPLALLGAFVFHKAFSGTRKGAPAAFLIFSVLTLAVLGLYLAVPVDMHIRNFNLRSALPVYAELDNGWNFTLQDVAAITDMQVFEEEDSNLASQDPMFGYEGEFFKPKAVVGPIFQVNDGHYNMTNPASFVFPEENGLQPFDLFREDQKADLELFISHQQPNLEISGWQRVADWISLAALIVSVLYLVYASIKGSIRFWQMNAR